MGNNLHGNGNGNKFPSATGSDDNPVLHRKQQLVKVEYHGPWAYIHYFVMFNYAEN